MPHRRRLLVLVTGLTVLITTFAVLMAFHSLFSALGDAVAARVLFGFAIACLVLLVVDVLLLVGVLGMRASRIKATKGTGLENPKCIHRVG